MEEPGGCRNDNWQLAVMLKDSENNYDLLVCDPRGEAPNITIGAHNVTGGANVKGVNITQNGDHYFTWAVGADGMVGSVSNSRGVLMAVNLSHVTEANRPTSVTFYGTSLTIMTPLSITLFRGLTDMSMRSPYVKISPPAGEHLVFLAAARCDDVMLVVVKNDKGEIMVGSMTVNGRIKSVFAVPTGDGFADVKDILMVMFVGEASAKVIGVHNDGQLFTTTVNATEENGLICKKSKGRLGLLVSSFVGSNDLLTAMVKTADGNIVIKLFHAVENKFHITTITPRDGLQSNARVMNLCFFDRDDKNEVQMILHTPLKGGKSEVTAYTMDMNSATTPLTPHSMLFSGETPGACILQRGYPPPVLLMQTMPYALFTSMYMAHACGVMAEQQDLIAEMRDLMKKLKETNADAAVGKEQVEQYKKRVDQLTDEIASMKADKHFDELLRDEDESAKKKKRAVDAKSVSAQVAKAVKNAKVAEQKKRDHLVQVHNKEMATAKQKETEADEARVLCENKLMKALADGDIILGRLSEMEMTHKAELVLAAQRQDSCEALHAAQLERHVADKVAAEERHAAELKSVEERHAAEMTAAAERHAAEMTAAAERHAAEMTTAAAEPPESAVPLHPRDDRADNHALKKIVAAMSAEIDRLLRDMEGMKVAWEEVTLYRSIFGTMPLTEVAGYMQWLRGTREGVLRDMVRLGASLE